MRLVMKSGESYCNVRCDYVERQDDVIFAYRKKDGGMTASEFVGMFSLGSVDFLYVTEEKGGN